MDTFEGNKLIAEFMGANISYGFAKFKLEDSPWCSHTNFGFHMLRYHKSWDWLMPVVEKINNLKEGGIWSDPWGTVKILKLEKVPGRNYYRLKNEPAIKHVDTEKPINAFWGACVEFIKWYNSNQK